MNVEIVAVILAAGRGARFGGEDNKLLAPYEGQPLLRRVVETALASRAGRVVVVTGHVGEAIGAALEGLPVAFAHNPDFASGLASSLRTGIAAAGAVAGAVILLGDMPGVSAGVVDSLIAAFETAPDCAAIIPTHRGQRGNPVLLARVVFPRLGALQGDEGARRLLRVTDGVVELPVEDDAILTDIDTPADLARLTRS